MLNARDAIGDEHEMLVGWCAVPDLQADTGHVAGLDALIDRFMAEDFVEHEAIPGMDNTRDTPKQLFKMMLHAFPDFRATVHELLQDGDKVVARVTFSGTHQGEFMGAPASGNHVEWSVIDIIEVRGDKAVAHWGVMDMAGAMAQMGAAPH